MLLRRVRQTLLAVALTAGATIALRVSRRIAERRAAVLTQ